jgi:hypothetical protein
LPIYVTPLPAGFIREQAGRIAKPLQGVCHDTLDFVSVPGFPSAICVFALTHSGRIVVQRLPWLISVSFGNQHRRQ